MRPSVFNYLKDSLADYQQTDALMKQRLEELKYPYKATDLNAGIKKQGVIGQPVEAMILAIAADRRLAHLEKNKLAISECLAQTDEVTRTIIEEVYLKKRATVTMIGIAQKLYISKNSAYRLRNTFFEKLADELGI